MDFDLFAQQVSKIKDLDLPGEAAHLRMAPALRPRRRDLDFLDRQFVKRAGVMALFYPGPTSSTRLLLIRRKAHPKDLHSDQIGFPGGQFEPEDTDLRQTALRETQEEVGVPSQKVELVRSLSPLYIPVSNFEVQPFIGLYRKDRPFTPEISEVAAVIEVALADFLDDMAVAVHKRSTSYAGEVDIPVFRLNGQIVWGATAMMMSEIKELLRQVL